MCLKSKQDVYLFHFALEGHTCHSYTHGSPHIGDTDSSCQRPEGKLNFTFSLVALHRLAMYLGKEMNEIGSHTTGRLHL